MTADDPLDLLIIGGGIGGVISLYYARRAGLKALLLEKQSVVGGLWAQLPAWQDIQINRNDWTLGDLPIDGEHQPSVAANIRAWVERFGLAASMRLNTPVTRAEVVAGGWKLSTPAQVYFSRYLICASGGHNQAFIPPTPRADARVRELHSSTLQDPTELAGKAVLVVGGGASAYDLLDLSLRHAARRVVWVHRSLRWMVPTRKPKATAGGIRDLARQQMAGLSVAQLNEATNLDLQGRYAKFGLQDICPPGQFDFDQHQLIPGRAGMIEHFGQIERHRGEISRIAGHSVALSDGTQLEADLILWGTGYTLDLRYFAVPALAQTRTVDALAKRCGALFRALDAPQLFFLAVGLESTGSAPWAYAHACKTIIAHIQGKAQISLEPVQRKINHYALAQFLAPMDPENYPPQTWQAHYQTLALTHPDGVPMPIP